MKLKAAVGILSTLCLASTAGAVVVVTQQTFQRVAGNAYPVSDSDLINGLSPTTDYNSIDGANVSRLTNGITSDDGADRSLDLNGFTATYSLDLGANPLGYVVTAINTFAGAGDYRARQEYLVYYRLVFDDPTTLGIDESTDFVQLMSPGPSTTDRPAGIFQTANSSTPGDTFPAFNAGGETKIEISITGLSGVKDIRFVSTAPSGNNDNSGNTSYKEFDVIGSAVPEPSSFALLLVGVATLLGQRRRNG